MAVSNSTYKMAVASAGTLTPVFRINCGGNLITTTDGSPSWRADNVPGYFEGDGFIKYNALIADTSGVPWVKGSTIPDYIEETVYNTLFDSESYIGNNISDIRYEIPSGLVNGQYIVRIYTGDDTEETTNYFTSFINGIDTGNIFPYDLFGGNNITGIWDSPIIEVSDGSMSLYFEPYDYVFFMAIEILKID